MSNENKITLFLVKFIIRSNSKYSFNFAELFLGIEILILYSEYFFVEILLYINEIFFLTTLSLTS